MALIEIARSGCGHHSLAVTFDNSVFLQSQAGSQNGGFVKLSVDC